MDRERLIAVTSLPRVVECPGYLPMVDAGNVILDDGDDNRDEGIRAHKIAEIMFKGGNPSEYPEHDEEMLESAQIYVDYVQSIYEPDKGHLLIESELPYAKMGIIARPDLVYFNRIDNILHVFDFKYGHRFVDAFESYQLIGGAACALYHTLSNPNTTVHLHIVQPRCFVSDGPTRKWIVTRPELAYYFDRIVKAVELYRSDEFKPCIVGSHCYKCPVAHVCKALAVASTYSVHDAYSSEPVEQLSDHQMGFFLTRLEMAQLMLNTRIEALKTDAEFRLRQGRRIPGYHLESTWGRAKWKYDPETVRGMGQLMGLDFSKVGTITPAQAKKLPGADPDLIDQWSGREQTAPKLMTNKADTLTGLKWGDD